MSAENQQPALALELANRVRAERAILRRQIRASHDYRESRAVLAGLLNEPPHAIHRLLAVNFLQWTWGMYRQVARRLLAVADASEFVMVGRLTVRQRTVLATLLRARDLDVALKDAELEHELKGGW